VLPVPGADLIHIPYPGNLSGMLAGKRKDRVRARLKRIEGQVRGILRMVDEDKYCVDVLLQISAARAALRQAGRVILERHLETCVTAAFTSGDEEQRRAKIEELLDIIKKST